MAYTALYRKFRPATFSEMVGQEHIIRTLKNQIIANRVGHAYLFNGSRGTGKTTTAKVFARAINCLNPKDGEPCNECEICKQALSGSLTDIVEMDAASNNSVEDIRSIREEVNFLPTLAKYRVYIIDEVHMLSTGAFNALLKTLEEPPEHVKFILATTEPQKLPATILSRCQRFDFKRLSVLEIISRLQIICKESNITITDNAIKLIAVLAEGGMRDAISILERCSQDVSSEINEDNVRELVGIPKIQNVNKLVTDIINCDSEAALSTIDEVIDEGKDLDNFLWEIIKYIKDLLVCKSNGKLDLYTEDELKDLKALSSNISKERLLNLIYNFSELANSMKWSSQKIIIFQTGIIKNCNLENSSDLESRVSKIENMLKSGAINASPVVKTSANNVPAATTNKVNPVASTTKKQPVSDTNQKTSINYWPTVIEDLKKQGKVMLYTNLINTTAKEINDMTLGIEFPNGLTAFGKTVLEKPENMQTLVKLVSIQAGKEMRIKLIDLKKEQQEKIENSEPSILTDLSFDINVVDE